MLAIRLHSVLPKLPKLISIDQSGCIKGKSTFTNLRSTIDITNYSNENQIHGLLAFIDYEKAFDTVRLNLIPYSLKCLNLAGIIGIV